MFNKVPHISQYDVGLVCSGHVADTSVLYMLSCLTCKLAATMTDVPQRYSSAGDVSMIMPNLRVGSSAADLRAHCHTTPALTRWQLFGQQLLADAEAAECSMEQ